MSPDAFAAIVKKQIEDDAHVIVSHAHNMVHIEKRYQEFAAAYATYAPRYEGDDEYDDEDYEAELSDDPLALDSILTEDGESFEFEPADAEAAERDYMEIIEYLRLAAMTVFSEYGWVEIIEQQQQKQALPASEQPTPPGATQFFKSGNKTMH